MDDSLYQHFSCLLNETSRKTEEEVYQATKYGRPEIYYEYDQLEQVPPAPGNPGMQHDMMVQKGE